MSLRARLEAMRKASAERIPEEARAIMHRATDDLRQSGLADSMLKKGATLPAFSLASSDGQTISTDDLAAKGRFILTFFRGSW